MRYLSSAFLAVALTIFGFAATPANAQHGVQKWAAVAVSTHPGKDAYAFQYLKDSEAGAIQDVIATCERILAQRGFHNGRCVARASTEWVIGMYCRSGHSTIGVGSTPLDAAMDAIRQASQSRDCDFKAMRHGTYDKAIIRDASWSVSLQCHGRVYHGRASHGTDVNNAAMIALNQAFLRCAGPTGCAISQFGTSHRFAVTK